MGSTAREVARLLGFRGRSGKRDELAAMSRRVLRWAFLLTALGAGAFLPWSPRAAGALTVAGLVSSFSFRGLEMQVRALEPNADGHVDARSILLIVLRYSLLSVFIILVLLVGSFGSREFIALILGFTVVPLALLVTGLAARPGSVR